MFWLIFVFLFLYAFLLREYNPMIFKQQVIRVCKLTNHLNFTLFYNLMNVKNSYYRWFIIRKFLN